MADDTGTPTPDAPEGDDGQQETPPKPSDGIPPEVKAALRKANKEAETLRLKLKEFEDRDKSDVQKLTDRAEAAERAAAEQATAAERLAVAFEKGLTPAQAKRLVGSTRDELEADADEVLRDFPAPTARPGGSIDQGRRGSALPESAAGAFARFMGSQSS